MIRLRFVTSNALSSRLIRMQAGVSMPFTPSHVEALTVDGKNYIGAHIEDGVRSRPVGYDADDVMTLPDGRKADLVVSLLCTTDQEDAFYTFVEGKVGAPYDFRAILGFGLPDFHEHDFGHLICSAFMVAALRSPGCEFFKWPLSVPFHHISPRDLFLILSSHVEIPH